MNGKPGSMYFANMAARADTSGGCPNATRMGDVFHRMMELETRKKETTMSPVKE